MPCTVLTLTLCLLAPTGHTQAEAPAPFTMARTQILEVAATARTASYRMSVSLPNAYDSGDSRFPVVYVLDGDWYFGIAASTARLLEAVKELPPVIVVAIGYGGTIGDQQARRIRELTPEPVDGLAGSGEAQKFLDALQTTLLPMIESRFRTSGDRALVGHSLGGLFATYAITQAPALFQRVVIGSPALRAAGPALIKRLSAQQVHPRRIFLASAEDDYPFVLEGHQQLQQWLATATSAGAMRWSAVTFAGMTHQSVIAPLFAGALPWVFRDN